MPGDGSVHDHRDDRGARERPDNGSSPGVGAGERHVLALLQHIHSRLADRAGQLPSDVVDRRSFCSEWSIAQVYSHLGSGAEIGALALSAVREGSAPPDPWQVWNRWDAKASVDMVTDFAPADRAYLQAFADAVAAAESGESLLIPVDGQSWPLLIALTARLVEMALHEWDVAVAEDSAAEVDAEAAAWLLMAYPLDLVGQAAATDVVERLAPRTIEVEISEPRDRLWLGLLDSGARLHRGPQPQDRDAVLTLPDAATWVRLVSGRWRTEADDARSSVRGNFPLTALNELFAGF